MDTDLVDIRVSGRGGTLVQLQVVSPRAREWIDEKVDAPSYMWLGQGTLCIEHRYVDDIIDGMVNDGLVVED